MQTLATRITRRGQISIPADVRKQLKWTPGRELFWEVAEGGECRVFARKKSPYVGALAMLGYGATFSDDNRTTDEWMKELREGEEE